MNNKFLFIFQIFGLIISNNSLKDQLKVDKSGQKINYGHYADVNSISSGDHVKEIQIVYINL